MSVITITDAVRDGARGLFVFAGQQGTGKTFSAIQFAYGLAGFDASKVGLLDTENGRGRLNADILQSASRPTKTRFRYAQLAAPFSPERYRSAVLEFQQAGIDVLVVDSGSHEWDGFGGCDEIARAPGADGKEPKVARWNLAKREHRRFVNTLLQCDMHVIVCLRAQEKTKIVDAKESPTHRTEFVSLGVLPICEKNFMFEATASILMHDMGARYEKTKVPAALLPIFPGDKYITADTGHAVRQWIDAGGEVNPHVEKYRNRLLTVTEQGARYVETAWAKVPKEIQAALGESFYGELEAAALEFDRQRELSAEPETMTAINQEIAAQKVAPPHLDFN